MCVYNLIMSQSFFYCLVLYIKYTGHRYMGTHRQPHGLTSILSCLLQGSGIRSCTTISQSCSLSITSACRGEERAPAAHSKERAASQRALSVSKRILLSLQDWSLWRLFFSGLGKQVKTTLFSFDHLGTTTSITSCSLAPCGFCSRCAPSYWTFQGRSCTTLW